jgi:hypothetical protein
MHEVFAESLTWANLPFTVLLGVVVVYWILVALGALDMNLFGEVDADLHAELHVDGHVDGDVHFDGDAHVDGNMDGHPLVPGDPPHLTGDKAGGISKELIGSDSSFLVQALAFLNVGQVPVMFVASVLVLCLWLGSMVANHYFTGGSVALVAALIVPNLIVSVIVTRYVTLPFRPLFRALTNERDEQVAVIGQRCVIVTSEATPEFGQAEIKTEGAPLLLNVRTMHDAHLMRGDVAVVVRRDTERDFHFIAPLPNNNTTH